jgi:hypothetical protein
VNIQCSFISETSLAADMYHMRQCSVKTEEPFWRHSHKLPAGTRDEKKLSLAAQRTSTSTSSKQPKKDTKTDPKRDDVLLCVV